MKKQITNFAIELDDNTKNQFEHCCEQDFVVSASLMPDAHIGYVAPIGSVLVTKDYLVPAWVGYDIGCGMIACKIIGVSFDKVKEKANQIYLEVNKVIPMGEGKYNHIQDVSKETKEKFKELLNKFKEKEYNEEVFRFLKNKALSHLGTLGGGNHFIELGYDSEKNIWLIIHSGSRGVGHTVATKYMKKASGKSKGYEATHPIKVDSLEGREYLNILDFGLEFALQNRLEMAYKVRDILREVVGKNVNFELWCNKNHNHAIKIETQDLRGELVKPKESKESDTNETQYYIHRKGATPAKKGERGVIPANMKEGCFLVEGLGNRDFIESSSHGAGRKMSRTQAKNSITMKNFKEQMQGIVGTISEKTLDEAPDAYKNIYDVMEKQKESVKVLEHVKPIINWKG